MEAFFSGQSLHDSIQGDFFPLRSQNTTEETQMSSTNAFNFSESPKNTVHIGCLFLSLLHYGHKGPA